VLKSQPYVEIEGAPILQSRGEHYLLSVGMCLRNRVPQDSRSDAPALLVRCDLNLPNLERIGQVEPLDHTYAGVADLDDINLTSTPALFAMT
jgi:hypothetical protein